MEYANILLAIGGDAGQTVPKYRVSAAEIAVLQAIHGEQSVTEVEPLDREDGGIISNREELARLRRAYGHAKDSDDNSIVDALFPGAAARVFTSLDELGLHESLYKAERRVEKKADPLDHDGDGRKGGSLPSVSDLDAMTKAELLAHAKSLDIDVEPAAKKADIISAINSAQDDSADDEEDDEIEDLDDEDDQKNSDLFK